MNVGAYTCLDGNNDHQWSTTIKYIISRKAACLPSCMVVSRYFSCKPIGWYSFSIRRVAANLNPLVPGCGLIATPSLSENLEATPLPGVPPWTWTTQLVWRVRGSKFWSQNCDLNSLYSDIIHLDFGVRMANLIADEQMSGGNSVGLKKVTWV